MHYLQEQSEKKKQITKIPPHFGGIFQTHFILQSEESSPFHDLASLRRERAGMSQEVSLCELISYLPFVVFLFRMLSLIQSSLILLVSRHQMRASEHSR